MFWFNAWKRVCSKSWLVKGYSPSSRTHALHPNNKHSFVPTFSRRSLEINYYNFSCKRKKFSCNGHMRL